MGLYVSQPAEPLEVDESPPLEEIVDHRVADHTDRTGCDESSDSSNNLPSSIEPSTAEVSDNIFSDLPPATQIALWKKALHDIALQEIINPPPEISSFEFDYETKVEYITLAIRLCPILAAWETELSQPNAYTPQTSQSTEITVPEFWRRLFYSLQLRLDNYMVVLALAGALTTPQTRQSTTDVHIDGVDGDAAASTSHSHASLPSAAAIARGSAPNTASHPSSSSSSPPHSPPPPTSTDPTSPSTPSIGLSSTSASLLSRALLLSLSHACYLHCNACNKSIPLSPAAITTIDATSTYTRAEEEIKGNENASVGDAVVLVRALLKEDVSESTLLLYSKVLGVGRSENMATNDEMGKIKTHPCVRHDGNWELDKSGKEFQEFPEELKNNLRQEKRKRLTEVSEQLKWIPDEDGPEKSTGMWSCCGGKEYTTKGCRQLPRHHWELGVFQEEKRAYTCR